MQNIFNTLGIIAIIDYIWTIVTYIVVIGVAVALVVSYIIFFHLKAKYNKRYREVNKL